MTNEPFDTGVILSSGASDYQIFQQGDDGTADIALSGSWSTRDEYQRARVMVRLVREDCYEEIGLAFTWQAATLDEADGWSLTLAGVPAGGLYRLETALLLDDQPVEWALRGDMVHHLGVGDVWMITGQSNSSGYGKTPVYDPPELGIHMFHAAGDWRLAAHPLSDSTGSRYIANRERANGSHAPWLAFARRLKRELGYPIGLIPAALGGSPLQAWTRGVSGELFENMLLYFQDSGTSHCRGAVWYQGESDVGDATRALYRERFETFVADIRKELRSPALPVITVQLNRVINAPPEAEAHSHWEQMRELQRQISHESDGIHIISAIDLNLSDVIHTDSAGNMVLGDRAASMALGAVYGRDVKHLHPDLARVTRPNASTIDLHFDNVDTRLNYEGANPLNVPFRVTDESGVVPIASCTVTQANVVRLSLERALEGAAEVTGAPSTAPPNNVPVDICGYRPMLAFTAQVPRG